MYWYNGPTGEWKMRFGDITITSQCDIQIFVLRTRHIWRGMHCQQLKFRVGWELVEMEFELVNRGRGKEIGLLVQQGDLGLSYNWEEEVVQSIVRNGEEP
jgi:hypothetical protein